MVRALARASQWLCTALLPLALLAGAAGFLAPAPAPRPELVADVQLADPDLMQIDQVLAHRAPELGLLVRRRVAGAILEESRAARYDPMFVLGLIETESSFIGDATSVAGARGLMQLMPVTLDYLAGLEGVRLSAEEVYRDPAMQVRIGVRYLKRLERRFKSLDLALMAYNGGPGRLEQALAEGDSDTLFGNYVRTVRLHQARFRRRLPPSLAHAARPALLHGTDVARMP